MAAFVLGEQYWQIIFAGAVFGVVLARLLERTQRTHLLTVLRLFEQAQKGKVSTAGLASERAAIQRAFESSSLPPLLLRARVDMGDLQLQHAIGNGTFGRVSTALWFNHLSEEEDVKGSGGGMTGGIEGGGDGDTEPEARLVAVKLLHQHHLTHQVLHRIVRAAELELSLPRHPNVVAMLGASWSVDSARVQLISEYCSGGSLNQALESGSVAHWSTADKLRMAREIAEGLMFLHEHLVIHRDLKPDNILLMKGAGGGGGSGSSDGSSGATLSPKIADFSESRLEAKERTMTHSRGTLLFAPPEVRRLDCVRVWPLAL